MTVRLRRDRERVRAAYRGTHNVAQAERKIAADEVKRIADVENVRGGETWGAASGHSGPRAAWLASWIVIAGFALAGIGLTVGPRLLIWIGAGITVVTGVLGMATHVWSDYGPDPGDSADRSAD